MPLTSVIRHDVTFQHCHLHFWWHPHLAVRLLSLPHFSLLHPCFTHSHPSSPHPSLKSVVSSSLPAPAGAGHTATARVNATTNTHHLSSARRGIRAPVAVTAGTATGHTTADTATITLTAAVTRQQSQQRNHIHLERRRRTNTAIILNTTNTASHRPLCGRQQRTAIERSATSYPIAQQRPASVRPTRAHRLTQ